MDADAVALYRFCPIAQFLRLHKSFRTAIQTLLTEGFKPNKKGDATTFPGLSKEFFILCDLDGRKTHPLHTVAFKDFKESKGMVLSCRHIIVGKKEIFSSL